MKKYVALFMSLLCLCTLLTIPAMATSSSSTTTSVNQATVASPVADGAVITVGAKAAAVAVKACEAEIEKLAAAESVKAYFANVTDKDGKEVDLAELVGTEELKVLELQAISADGFDGVEGDVEVKMVFATPYTVGEKVAVVIGFVTDEAVEWIALEGEVVESETTEAAGTILVSVPGAVVERIQKETAVVAVVSK